MKERETRDFDNKNPTPERFSFFGGCCGQWFNCLASKLYHYAHWLSINIVLNSKKGEVL